MNYNYLWLPYNVLRKPLKVRIRPLHLQIEPTDACNQKCIMCYRDRLIEKTSYMSFDLFQKAIDEIRPAKVNISGLGEPLLHKNIYEMIAYAKNKGAGVTFPTNFTLAAGHLEKLVEKGVDVLKISLDASSRETYREIRRTDHFEKVLETIKKLNLIKTKKNTTRPHIRINYALQKKNIYQVVEVMRLAIELKAEAVYIQYLDYVDVDDLKTSLVDGISAGLLKAQLQKAQSVAERYKLATNIPIWLRDLELYFNKMKGMGNGISPSRVCYFPWISTFIEANGDVKACPIFTRKRNVGKMGNILDQPFETIWNGKEYMKLRRDLKDRKRPFEPCYQCIPQTLSNILAIFSKLLPGW